MTGQPATQTCGECGHPAHAGRCLRMVITSKPDLLDTTECPCTTRRKTDGDADGTSAAALRGRGDGSVRRSSGDDAAALTKDMTTFLGEQAKWDLAERHMNRGGLPPSLP